MTSDQKPAQAETEKKEDVVKAAAKSMKQETPSPEQAAQPQQIDPRLEYANTMNQIGGVLSKLRPAQQLLDRLHKEKFITAAEYRNAMIRIATVPRALNLFAGSETDAKATAPAKKASSKDAAAKEKEPVIVDMQGKKMES